MAEKSRRARSSGKTIFMIVVAEGAASGMAVGYTEPRFDEHVGQDYQFTGKLMPATLRHACMDAESDVYLCGSEIFVEYVRNIILQYRTIPADHIHTQVFVRTR